MDNSDGTIKVIHKAIQLLQFFADSDNKEHTVLEISRNLKISRTTVYRILDTLIESGFVEKNGATNKYSLGWEIFHIGVKARDKGIDYSQIAAYGRELSSKVGESVNISRMQGHYGLVIDSFKDSISQSVLFVQVPAGSREPLYSTAYGKALLFDHSLSKMKVLFEDVEFLPLTSNTLLSVEELYEDILLYKEKGYALALGEYETGINAIAAPIRNFHGRIEWAVSIAAPEQRRTPENIEELADRLLETAGLMSRALGYK